MNVCRVSTGLIFLLATLLPSLTHTRARACAPMWTPLRLFRAFPNVMLKKNTVSRPTVSGWSWADEMLQAATAFQGGVELVCTPGPGEVRRFGLSLPPGTERPAFASRSLGRAADGRRRSGRADTVSSKFKTVRGEPKSASSLWR